VVGDALITGNVSDLNVVSNVNMLHTSNTASIKLNSNVVTEFPRSKKLIKYPRIILPRSAVGSTYNDYRIDRSSEHVTGSYLGVQDLFNNTATDGSDTWGAGWQGSSGSYSTSTGEHSTYVTGGTTQGTAARLASNVPNGEWVSLQLPNAIQLNRVKIRSRNNTDWYIQYPTDFEFWGSNDNGTTWSHIKSFSNKAAAAQATFSTFQVDSTKVYSRIALVVTKIPGTASTVVVSTGHAHFSISELHLYGTPEYDPEAHGTDVTVKSYANVPNTDWLEVYYDAKNYTGGVVQDESLNSYVGTLNSVTLDNSGIQSFDIPDGGSISATLTSIPSADFVHSVSVWVKFEGDTLTTSYPYLYFLGATGSYNGIGLYCAGASNPNKLHVSCWSLDFPINFTFSNDTWHHVTYTYSGGGWSRNSALNAYVDGIEYSLGVNRSSGTEGTTPTLTTSNVPLRIGTTSTGGAFDGKIANFRLFNRALTSDEIYQLYAYQKEYFGHGDLSMTLKAGRLGIGTSEPRAALDVRGDIIGGCPVFFSAWCSTQPDTNTNAVPKTIIWNKVTSSKGGGYDASTGIFTAPLPGYYRFYYTARCRYTYGCWLRVYVNNAYIEGNFGYHTIYLSTGGMQGGNEIIVKLEQGHDFRVVLLTTNNQTSGIADNYNGFNGQYISSL
jgi:hypothetical protein